MQTIKKLFDFIKAAPTAFQAVAVVRERLMASGYSELVGNTKIIPGGKYFTTKNGTSLIAFAMPEVAPLGYLVAASHSDSPTYQIKDNPELAAGGKYIKLNVAPYGGMLCSTWLDRPLSVAGRVMVKTENGVRSVLVNIDKDLLLIPNLAIHMNRQANSGFEFKANVDMLPLFATAGKDGAFIKTVSEAAGCAPEDILSTELYLYNRTSASQWGADGEFISAPRLDDLQCAFATLEGFIKQKNRSHAIVYMLCDNEEIGSETKQGAGSQILYDVLQSINLAYGQTHTDYTRALENSFMLSCDNAHAMHPNHGEVADASNVPVPNGGVVIKYGVRYATDSVAEAIFKEICNLASVPYQTYSNRSDMAGGSTLGNISNATVSMPTVDIGLAQLAMHSAYETAGAFDTDHMINAVKAFFSTNIRYDGAGGYSLR